MAGICVMPVMADFDNSHCYILGPASGAAWDPAASPEMTALGNNVYLWDGQLQPGEFKFSTCNTKSNVWWNCLVACQDNMAVTAEDVAARRSYGLDFVSAGAPDYKFVNSYTGHVRIVLDRNNATVNFRKPDIALVGDAAGGWDLDKALPVFADDEGNLSWTGILTEGELKFLEGDCKDWWPGYTAPADNLYLIEGGHQLVHNTSDYDADGNWVDYKYHVNRPGLYTLTFKRDNVASPVWGVDVRMAEAPAVAAYSLPAGRYLAGVDRQDGRLHLGAVPGELYIFNHFDEGDCQQLTRSGESVFTATVNLRKGSYYKLTADRANPAAYALSPSSDTDISSAATVNVAPMYGNSYTVGADGKYFVVADFSGDIPSLSATRQTASSVDTVVENGTVGVRSSAGEIWVEGEWQSVAVYDVSGRIVGRTSPCRVIPGTYIVNVDNNIFKISAR